MRNRLWRGFALSASLVLAATGVATAADPGDDGAVPIVSDAEAHHDHDQHGGIDGHLPASSSHVELVGKMRINQDFEGRVADVGALGDYAYLAAWSAPDCQKGGVYVFDISNPARPKQINFIRTGNDSYAGEGVHVVHLSTEAWTGDLLAYNNEDCTNNAGKTSAHSHGGASFVDVTNPKVHKYLAEGAGDRSVGALGPQTEADAHEIHSVFVWEDEANLAGEVGDKAYAVTVDNEESYNVDILDITDPRAPVLVAEYNLNTLFPQIIQGDLGSGSSFLHDMVVKEIGGHEVMLLSYWDGGYVTMNVDEPTAPSYIGDTDFANPDPELLESTGTSLPPEGNGHQAEFTLNNDRLIVADEDFGPYAPFISIAGGPTVPFSAGVATTGPQLGEGDTLAGPTRYLGEGCSALPAAQSADQIALIERGTCTFQAKIDNAAAAGYAAAIIFNHQAGCEGLVNMSASVTIEAFFVARSSGFAILGIPYNPADCASSDASLPAVPSAGQPISISVQFDGWGYVHLYENEAGKMTELDTFAIPEAHDASKAFGFGDLSVHEVAVSQQRNDLAYLSYYAGGLRVLEIQGDELVEVGHYIDAGGDGGNNFWGVQVWEKGGVEYVLASDRDYGLYIFRYTP